MNLLVEELEGVEVLVFVIFEDKFRDSDEIKEIKRKELDLE